VTLIVVTLTLSGCATTTGISATSAVTSVACRSFQPITWSSRDTDETILEVKAHNAVWSELCNP
jgi:hypothetical protein